MKILFFTDVHLVGKSNINRKDNLVETQIDKLNELGRESTKVDLIMSCGDIFHKHDPSISTMKTFSDFIEKIDSQFVLCPGNHDLYGYNYDGIGNTGLGYVCSFYRDKIILMKDDMQKFVVDDVTIHFKRTIDKEPMTEFNVDRSETKYHIGMIHDMVFHKDFFDSVTVYKDFDTNLDVLFNGHIHHGHDPILLNGTWFLNPGSISRMHKPKPYFDVRYIFLNLNKEIIVEQKKLKTSKNDVFNTFEKKDFVNFIDKIEAENIQTNAIDYMFKNATNKLSNGAFQMLKDLYGKVD